MSRRNHRSIAAMLTSVLDEDIVNALGRKEGLSQRLRVVTPARLAVTLIGVMAGHTVKTIADILRAFNYDHEMSTAYKAFYNRLAQPGFAAFMREIVSRLLTQSWRMLPRPSAPSPSPRNGSPPVLATSSTTYFWPSTGPQQSSLPVSRPLWSF